MDGGVSGQRSAEIEMVEKEPRQLLPAEHDVRISKKDCLLRQPGIWFTDYFARQKKSALSCGGIKN
jgi:hypothetical protein